MKTKVKKRENIINKIFFYFIFFLIFPTYFLILLFLLHTFFRFLLSFFSYFVFFSPFFLCIYLSTLLTSFILFHAFFLFFLFLCFSPSVSFNCTLLRAGRFSTFSTSIRSVGSPEKKTIVPKKRRPVLELGVFLLLKAFVPFVPEKEQ